MAERPSLGLAAHKMRALSRNCPGLSRAKGHQRGWKGPFITTSPAMTIRGLQSQQPCSRQARCKRRGRGPATSRKDPSPPPEDIRTLCNLAQEPSPPVHGACWIPLGCFLSLHLSPWERVVLSICPSRCLPSGTIRQAEFSPPERRPGLSFLNTRVNQ
jgi:hypothetical protein